MCVYVCVCDGVCILIIAPHSFLFSKFLFFYFFLFFVNKVPQKSQAKLKLLHSHLKVRLVKETRTKISDESANCVSIYSKISMKKRRTE